MPKNEGKTRADGSAKVLKGRDRILKIFLAYAPSLA